MPLAPLALLPLLLGMCSGLSASWEVVGGALPQPPRSGHTSAADSNGRTVLFSGYAEEVGAAGVSRAVVNDLWEFSEGSWRRLETHGAEQPGARLCSASAIVDNSFYLFGGWDPLLEGTGGRILDDVWKLDLSSLCWERIGSMPGGPTSRHVAATASTPQGPLVLVHTFRSLESILAFDPRTQTFSEKACAGEAPSARGLHVGAALGEKLFIFGGAAKSGEMANDAFLLHTGDRWTWERLQPSGPVPSARAGASACALDSETAVVCGGAEASETGLVPRADVWALRLEGGGGGSGSPDQSIVETTARCGCTECAGTEERGNSHLSPKRWWSQGAYALARWLGALCQNARGLRRATRRIRIGLARHAHVDVPGTMCCNKVHTLGVALD